METITFTSSKMFLKWAHFIVGDNDRHYDRTPVPKQVWIYGDGHVEETGYGKQGSTMLSNLKFVLKTGTGELDHSKERRLVDYIDSRGGVTITIHWPEQILKNGL